MARHGKSLADIITELFLSKYHELTPNRTMEHCDLQVFLHILYHLILKTLGDR